MKLKELIRDLTILETTADPEQEITGVAYDSRLVEKGNLFVAVKGFASDGHRFIPKALEKGAAAILCQDAPGEGVPFLRVADTRLGLALVSRAFFGDPASKMCMIGFTGTNGKTTSSYLMKHLLEEALGAKVGLIGTNGIMIGQEFLPSERTTPESYELHSLFRRMLDAGCTHVVMEVSSHSLSLERVAGIRFDVGLFTNLTQDHLDFHGSMEEYAAAKRKLFGQCRVGCFNLDDPWAPYMMEGAACRCLGYSAQSNDADLVAKDVRLSADGVRFAAVTGEGLCLTRLGIPGMFSVHNALGVLTAGIALGISLEDCCREYGQVIILLSEIYYSYVQRSGVDLEVLLNEADTPTGAAGLYFLANELCRRGIAFQAVCPRLELPLEAAAPLDGEAESLREEAELLASVSRSFGFKLSFRNLEQKPELLTLLGEAAGYRLHASLGGLSWLEALRLLAREEPVLFRLVYGIALTALPVARQVFPSSLDESALPSLDGLEDNALPGLLSGTPVEQLLELTYGQVLHSQLKDRLAAFLRSHAAELEELVRNRVRADLDRLK